MQAVCEIQGLSSHDTRTKNTCAFNKETLEDAVRLYFLTLQYSLKCIWVPVYGAVVCVPVCCCYVRDVTRRDEQARELLT